MRSLTLTVVVLTFVSASLMGCDTISPFESEKSGIAQSLEFHLSAPDTVALRDSFEVRFAIQNHGDQDIRLTTGDSCLLDLSTFLDGERVAFKGTQVGCFQAVVTHRVPANDTLERTFLLQASGYEGKESVTPGTYTIEADFAVSGGPGLNGETVRRVIHHELIVRGEMSVDPGRKQYTLDPEAQVGLTVTNKSNRALFLPICGPDLIFVVQRHERGRWESYSGGGCLAIYLMGYRRAVDPGASVRMTTSIREVGRYRVRLLYKTSREVKEPRIVRSEEFAVKEAS